MTDVMVRNEGAQTLAKSFVDRLISSGLYERMPQVPAFLFSVSNSLMPHDHDIIDPLGIIGEGRRKPPLSKMNRQADASCV